VNGLALVYDAAMGGGVGIEGWQIGRYQVESLIGEGGMGRVYRARSPDGVPVAVKQLRPELSRDAAFRKRFAREARVALEIDHRHVVSTLETGQYGEELYLVQEFIDGGSLRDLLRRDGRLPVPKVLGLCAEIASGVDAMHAAGVVHRDLKPDNVMLDSEGGAQVADFGLCKDSQTSTVLTAIGQTVGTVDYMAPEQVRGEAELDFSADLYSFGCLTWECLVGAPPFADRSGMAIMWAHLHEEPPDPSSLVPDLSADLSWALLRALEKEPSRRPATATEYAHMLQVAARADRQ
jgi:serine/threonine protein kinase